MFKTLCELYNVGQTVNNRVVQIALVLDILQDKNEVNIVNPLTYFS